MKTRKEGVAIWRLDEKRYAISVDQVIRYVGSQEECHRRAEILLPKDSRKEQDSALMRACHVCWQGNPLIGTRHSKRRFPRIEDDEKLVEKIAREVVDQHGADAIPILRERAKAADMSDEALAAETWRDVARAAERRLQERGGLNAE